MAFEKQVKQARDDSFNIAQGKKAITDLQNSYRSGEITFDDYLNQMEVLGPQLQELTDRVGRSGSHAIESARNYGFNEIRDSLKNWRISKSSNELLGRELTANELAQLKPAFEAGFTNGRAALAQYAEQYKQTPEYLSGQAGKYSGDVNSIFQELLNRGASESEVNHFGKMLASGQTDAFELSQFVQSLPEYQTKADTSFRSGLANELQGYDTSFFNKAKEDVISRFANQGTMGSSALDYALTDLMGNIAKERGSYLANLSSSQYGGNKAAAREDYLGSMNNYLGTMRGNRDRNNSLMDYYNQRGDSAYDYNIQKNDYLNYLNSMKQKRGGGMSGIGSLVGAGIGAAGAGMVSGGMGAPAGAALGAQLGGAAGRAYDYYNY